MLSRLQYLFDRNAQINCSSTEVQEWMILLLEAENQSAVKGLIDNFIQNTGSEITINERVANRILLDIIKKDQLLAVSTNKRNASFLLGNNVTATSILFLADSAHWVFNSTVETKCKGDMLALRYFSSLF